MVFLGVAHNNDKIGEGYTKKIWAVTVTAGSTKIETQNKKQTRGNHAKPNEHIAGAFLYQDSTFIKLSINDTETVFAHIAHPIQQTRTSILLGYTVGETQFLLF
jgi:hypothetical protein